MMVCTISYGAHRLRSLSATLVTNMYALRNRGTTYHILDPKTGLTVCGHRVSQIRRKFTSGESSLHWTPNQPLNKILCRHCVRSTRPGVTSDPFRACADC